MSLTKKDIQNLEKIEDLLEIRKNAIKLIKDIVDSGLHRFLPIDRLVDSLKRYLNNHGR